LKVCHKTVRYKLHAIEANAYRPTKKGIQMSMGDYDHINHEVTIHYAGSDSLLIPPEERITEADIEDEIRRMEPRLVKDTHINLNLPFHYGLKFILDNKVLNGSEDYLRSKTVMNHPVSLPKIEIKEINKHYGKSVLDESQDVFEAGEVIE
jgi:hypothetical protein